MMKKRNVLIVDDDPDVLSMLERLLKKLDYYPFVAQNGEEAVNVIDAQKIDVVVSDLVMPEMDGMELLKRVKSRKGDIPFVMITGHPTIETAVEAIKKGAYDYLTKPFQVEEVQIKIDRALEKRGLRRSLRWANGVIWALIFSIPIWLILGIILASILGD
jgi:two-component system response regulator PilR (NtrC family)